MPRPSPNQITALRRTFVTAQARLRRIQEIVLPASMARLAATDDVLSRANTRAIETWDRIDREWAGRAATS